MVAPSVEPSASISPAIAPRLAILLAATCWSLGGFFAKHPVFDSWPASDRGNLLCFWRAVFAAACVAPFVRRPCFRFALIPMATCFGLMSACYMAALPYTTAANAIWLQAIAPAWVSLYTWGILGERLHPKDIGMVAWAAVGTLIILIFESQGESLLGCGLALAAGAFYAGVIVSLRKLRDCDPFWLVLVNQCGAIAAASWGVYRANTDLHGNQLPWIAAFGVIQLGLPYIAFTWGLRTVSGPEAACIALMEPILLPLWVWLSIGERPAWWTVAGACVILAALAFRYAPSRVSTTATEELLPANPD